MRPVTIGVSANYAYHTPGSLNGNVPFFNAPSGLCTVYNRPLGFLRSIAWCGNQLLDKWVLGNPLPNPATANDRRLAKNLLEERLETIYTTARLPLVAIIGDYCSFCEIPLHGRLLATEHRSAKAPYPTWTVWWWNFALACPECNSQKGQLPSRATVTGWTGLANPTEANLYREIRDRYYWPNIDANTYRRIRVGFWMDTQNVPVHLKKTEFPDRRNFEVSAVGVSVKANVWQGGALRNNRDVEVQIHNRKPNAPGGRTLTLTGLNHQDTARSFHRTRAWLAGCLHLNLILNGVEALPNHQRAAAFASSWPLLLMLAVLHGFYSTFVRMLTERGFPAHVPAGGYASLGAKFVFDTQAANAPYPGCTFPGTNVTRVP